MQLNEPLPSLEKVQVHVAAFDFDGTLTRHDTLIPFLWHSLGPLKFAGCLVRSAPWLLAYAFKLMSNHKAKSRLLKVSLTGWTEDQARQHAAHFVQRELPFMWHTQGLRELTQHQRAGHTTLLVSASPNIYMQHVAKRLGVDGLLCTKLQTSPEGVYTGELLGYNCHGTEKVRRLQAWLAEHIAPEQDVVLHAYGDTRGDWPMLSMAQRAWYRGRPWVKPL
jgi:phosphatidylglycerophosphatase C